MPIARTNLLNFTGIISNLNLVELITIKMGKLNWTRHK